MNFSPEFLERLSDYKELYYWLRNILEQNEISLDTNYLLIFDIIGVTGKLHCIREIASPDESGIISLLHREIIQNLNFILQISHNLTEELPTTRLDFMGHKGDRIDIVGDAASTILLALLIKYSRLGKDTRLLMMEEGRDWEYRQETIGNFKVHNILLNHENLDRMPTRDPLSSSLSVLISPSLQKIIKILQAFSVINEFNIPNPELLYLNDTLPKIDNESKVEADIREAKIVETATIILRAGPDKEIATDYLLSGIDNCLFDLDSGRKNHTWISVTGENMDVILKNSFKTFHKFPHAQIFYTRNLAMFTQLMNGTPMCIDPYATNILSKLIRKYPFSSGIYIFNPKSPTQGFIRESIENHVGIQEPYDIFKSREM